MSFSFIAFVKLKFSSSTYNDREARYLGLLLCGNKIWEYFTLQNHRLPTGQYKKTLEKKKCMSVNVVSVA